MSYKVQEAKGNRFEKELEASRPKDVSDKSHRHSALAKGWHVH